MPAEKNYLLDKVNDNLYFLRPLTHENAASMVLVKGETADAPNVLIDTGEDSAAITDALIPALAELSLNVTDIGIVTFTHCHVESIGGLLKLKELHPNVCVAAPTKCADRILNPMYYLLEMRRHFPENNPPFREVKGTFVDAVISEGSQIAGFTLISAAGHDEDCYCWYHEPTRTLISGDSLQGNGNEYQGMPFYRSFAEYRRTIKRLMNVEINTLLCSHDMNGIGYSVKNDPEKCKTALRRCWECTEENDRLVKELKRTEHADIREIARAISEKNFDGTVPEHLFAAMFTVSEHYKRV